MDIANRALIDAVVAGVQEKKGRKIVVADLSRLDGAPASYFVICEGNTPTQVQAITDSVWDFARRQAGEKPSSIDGERNAEWVAMDYGTVIVHVFVPDRRVFYDLEHLWEDAPLNVIPDLD